MRVLQVRRYPVWKLDAWRRTDARLASMAQIGGAAPHDAEVTTVDCIMEGDEPPFDDFSLDQRFFFCIRSLGRYDALSLVEAVDRRGEGLNRDPLLFAANDFVRTLAKEVAHKAITKAIEHATETAGAQGTAAVAQEEDATQEVEDAAAQETQAPPAAAAMEETPPAVATQEEAPAVATQEEAPAAATQEEAPPAQQAEQSVEEPEWLMRANEAIRRSTLQASTSEPPEAETTAQTTTLLSDVVTVLTGVVPPALMLHLAKTRASVLTVDGDQRFVTTHSTATNQVRVGKLIVDLSSWKNRSYQARATQARDATPRPPVRRFLRTL